MPFFSLQFQMLAECSSAASVSLYSPKSKPLSPPSSTAVALTGLLTPTLFFFTLKKFFSRFWLRRVAAQTFSSCGEQGLLCSCSARALRCGGGSGHSTGPRARSHSTFALFRTFHHHQDETQTHHLPCSQKGHAVPTAPSVGLCPESHTNSQGGGRDQD